MAHTGGSPCLTGPMITGGYHDAVTEGIACYLCRGGALSLWVAQLRNPAQTGSGFHLGGASHRTRRYLYKRTLAIYRSPPEGEDMGIRALQCRWGMGYRTLERYLRAQTRCRMGSRPSRASGPLDPRTLAVGNINCYEEISLSRSLIHCLLVCFVVCLIPCAACGGILHCDLLVWPCDRWYRIGFLRRACTEERFPLCAAGENPQGWVCMSRGACPFTPPSG